MSQRPYAIEHRWPWRAWWPINEWHVCHRYATRERRDQALAVLRSKAARRGSGQEYRPKDD